MSYEQTISNVLMGAFAAQRIASSVSRSRCVAD